MTTPTPEELARNQLLCSCNGGNSLTGHDADCAAAYRAECEDAISAALAEKDKETETRLEREMATEGKLLDARAELSKAHTVNLQLAGTLETIAGFASGNGDVCEIIAKRARTALSGDGTEKYRTLLGAVRNAVGESFSDGMRPYVIERLHHAFAALQSGEPATKEVE